MTSTVSTHTALVYLMVIVSASDRDMSDEEFGRMGALVKNMPIFDAYDAENLIRDARNCAAILDDDDGLDAVLGLVAEAVGESHADTAYVVACDIAVADRHVGREELRILELIRHRLGLDRLTAGAIEMTITARHRRL